MEKENINSKNKDNKNNKKTLRTQLSKRMLKTGEDIAMLNERKANKKYNRNICDTHWDGA